MVNILPSFKNCYCDTIDASLRYSYFFFLPQSGTEMELIESQPLLEWLANNYKSFGATLEIITDKSQEGSQFVRGFGGIGGMYIILYGRCYGNASDKLLLVKAKSCWPDLVGCSVVNGQQEETHYLITISD